MICEWLSSGEWCDVQLQCSGHIFNAHRAVLASVSIYLREMLLSCTTEDSPVFIILPDFDLDAMTYVLYYIYHGEVIIPKCRLNMFLEIIQTMQIYVDHQSLQNFCDGEKKPYSYVKMYRESNVTVTNCNDMTSLDFVNNEGQQYANYKKRVEIENYKVQGSSDSIDFRDKQIRCCKWSEKFNSHVKDLKTRFGNRQRGSFLRDLFIETHARNGNSNGLMASVQEISNERYRGPKSVLFTNANDRDRKAKDTHTDSPEISSELYSNSSPAYKSLRFNRNFILSDKCQSENFQESLRNKYKKSQVNIKFLVDSDLKVSKDMFKMNEMYLFETEGTTLDLKITSSHSKAIDLTHAKKHNIEKSILIKDFDKQVLTNNLNKKNDLPFDVRNTMAKVSILNEVLRNPWCSRNNNYYKPFRRKNNNPVQKETDVIKSQIDSINDDNNNINVIMPSLISTDSTERNLNSAIKAASVTPHSLHLNVRNELKCTICNQIFISTESFASHMRRHSTVTRYRCEECSKTFSQLRNFKYHMSVHRGTKEFATTCPVCGKYFNDRGYLSSHMKIHKNRKEYKCTMCPKSFNQRVAYNMHVRIHTGVKPHVCDECGKAFSRKMLLKQHQRTHSGERPYACPHCNKRFADRSNMTLHLRLHTGIKPFSCSLCPKSFTKKHHLKSHLNFHTGAKPYSCPRCKLAFTQSSNMRTHYKKCSTQEAILTSVASS
ncbi:unnamed protein product [Parnassius apollo]|uniref:(apollo) hypothetical protein n=1 Tax=Parnassius apollo TaxID=110799 RepID=A0A8S3XSL7_PARAO|nr:unnamed protein product [Parnassius apollo]